MELISVIIPTYNRAKTILKSIQSVLNQTYENIELIVVDDGSTDETREILSELVKEGKIIYYYQPNGGASAARNTGISLAKGTLLAFQDSDDEWMLDKLEKQCNLYRETGAKVIYSDMLRIGKNEEESYFYSPSVGEIGDIVNPETMDYSTCCIGIGSCLIHKECFEKCGTFNETYPALEDLELLIRLKKEFIFAKIDQPLVKYFENEGVSSNTLNQIESRKKLMNEYILSNFDKNSVAYQEQCRLISFMYSDLGMLDESKKYAYEMVKENGIKINKYSLYYLIIKLNLLESLRAVRRKLIH